MLVAMKYEPGWGTLAVAVQQRRARLGMTQEDVASKGGPSTVTVRNIESGASTSFRARTLFQLDEALGWGKGTSQSIIEGDLPIAWFGNFDGFVEDVIKDTKLLQWRGVDDYVVGRSDRQPDLVVEGPGGVVVAEVKSSGGLANVSDEDLINELAHRLRRRSSAQTPQQVEDTGGSSGSRAGGSGAPIAPSVESMDQLRRLNGEDTERSRDDPKSG